MCTRDFNRDRARLKRAEDAEAENLKQRLYRENYPRERLLQSARERARRGKYPCTITVEDIVIPEFCPLLGLKLERSVVKKHAVNNSPSLDKIRPELGYVPGNVWVISYKANRIKNDASLEEMQMLVANWRRITTGGVT